MSPHKWSRTHRLRHGLRTKRSRSLARLLPLFDGFPYLVTRIGHIALRHIALLPADRRVEEIRAIARRQALANRLETCLVLGRRRSVYVDVHGAETPSRDVPAGGLLISGKLRLAEEPAESVELRRRAAALTAWIEAQTAGLGGGYIVGDGLDHGRPATARDLAHLDGTDPDGTPCGLARCPTCGELAGEMLDRRGDEPSPTAVLRVHCRCDDWNRCARCGESLKGRRLSAWYWDEPDRQAWYVPGFSAFGHRCPDEQEADEQEADEPEADESEAGESEAGEPEAGEPKAGESEADA